MEKEKRFRILNKTAKTVTVKIGKEPITSTWEEFNQSMVVVDKYWAVFNDEMKKKQDEIEDLLGFLTVHVLEMNAAQNSGDTSKELKAAYMVGSLMDKLQKISGFTTIQIMELVKQRLMVMNTVFMALIAEIANTAIETVVDRISLERHELSGKAKDIASSLVVAAFIGAGITWAIILAGLAIRYFG